MSKPQLGSKAADLKLEMSQGRDDPKGWEHTGIETLRDPKGGTYGSLPDMDVEQMPERLPKGLLRERKGPYGKTTGRRQGNDCVGRVRLGSNRDLRSAGKFAPRF